MAARAVDAARAVGLDVADIDLMANDISRPLEEQGGAVVEVNAGPGLQMHLEPTVRQAPACGRGDRDVGFPRANGRSPSSPSPG